MKTEIDGYTHGPAKKPEACQRHTVEVGVEATAANTVRIAIAGDDGKTTWLDLTTDGARDLAGWLTGASHRADDAAGRMFRGELNEDGAPVFRLLGLG